MSAAASEGGARERHVRSGCLKKFTILDMGGSAIAVLEVDACKKMIDLKHELEGSLDA